MDEWMDGFMQVIREIAIFLLFQTVLIGLLENTKYERYVRVVSGFLLILLLISTVLNLRGNGNLLQEIQAQVDYASEEQEMRIHFIQAEEAGHRQLLKEYEVQILTEAESVLKENRYFLREGEVVFGKEWEIEQIRLTIALTMKREEKTKGIPSEIVPVQIDSVSGSPSEVLENQSMTSVLQELQRSLAERLGISAERIWLEEEE